MSETAPVAFPVAAGLAIRERINLDALRAQISCPNKVLQLDNSEHKHRLAHVVKLSQAVDADGAHTVEFATNANAGGMGRYYACDKVSLQYGCKALRHAQMAGQWLTDMNNANYRFLLALATRHGLQPALVREYVERRGETLAKVVREEPGVTDRGAAKALLLSFITGSEYRPKSAWLKAFKKEVKRAVASLLELYPQFSEIKDSEHPERTGIFFLLSTCERWAVDVAFPIWTAAGVDITAYIYDALGSTEQVSQELCEAASAAFNAASGLEVVWLSERVPECGIWKGVTRERVEDRDVWDRAFQSYAQVKAAFEVDTFKVRRPLAYVHMGVAADGSSDMYMQSEREVVGVYRNKYFYEMMGACSQGDDIKVKGKRKRDAEEEGEEPKPWVAYVSVRKTPFMRRGNGRGEDAERPMWLDDEELRTYEMARFCPPPAVVAPNCFNTWRGFVVQNMAAEEEDARIVQEHILPFIFIIICACNKRAFDYLINWLAQMFQEPGVKSRTAIVLLGEEGVGKSKLTELIAAMVGIALAFRTTDLDNDCFGRFSNIAENRVLALFDELDPKELNANYNRMMELITGMTFRCENKGIGRPFTVANFLRVIITTNEEHNLMRVRSKDRKYQYISVSSARQNDRAYFAQLSSFIARKGVQRAFYDYLMGVNIEGFDFINDRAPCDVYELTKELNIRRETLFLAHLARVMPGHLGGNMLTDELFTRFMEYIKANTSGRCSEYSSSTHALGIFLSKVPGFTRRKSRGGCAAWDVDTGLLIGHLVTQGVLSKLEGDCVVEIRKAFMQWSAEEIAERRSSKVEVLTLGELLARKESEAEERRQERQFLAVRA